MVLRERVPGNWKPWKCLKMKERAPFFSISDDENTRIIWPFHFELEFEAIVGVDLVLTMSIQNRSALPFYCENGFHSYFSVEDVHQCQILNFDGMEYIDRTRIDARAITT